MSGGGKKTGGKKPAPAPAAPTRTPAELARSLRELAPVRLALDLTEEDVAFLRLLATSDRCGDKGTIEDVVEALVFSAIDGVRRPGAWEREWVTQVFGDDWTDELEVDPEASWRRRPRKASS